MSSHLREEIIGNHRVILGDCLEVMPSLPDTSVDCVLTDPPYGIQFMNLDFDRAVPDPAVWRECLRLLKPGGSMIAMSGSRLDCLWRLCRDIEGAGFELAQTAFIHIYKSGFCKGQDLSKAADGKAFREWLFGRPLGTELDDEEAEVELLEGAPEELVRLLRESF